MTFLREVFTTFLEYFFVAVVARVAFAFNARLLVALTVPPRDKITALPVSQTIRGFIVVDRRRRVGVGVRVAVVGVGVRAVRVHRRGPGRAGPGRETRVRLARILVRSGRADAGVVAGFHRPRRRDRGRPTRSLSRTGFRAARSAPGAGSTASSSFDRPPFVLMAPNASCDTSHAGARPAAGESRSPSAPPTRGRTRAWTAPT